MRTKKTSKNKKGKNRMRKEKMRSWHWGNFAMYIEEESFISLNEFYGFKLVKMINEEKRIT